MTEAPVLLVGPVDSTVSVGDEVSLTCRSFGNPTPGYSWYINAQHLNGKPV